MSDVKRLATRVEAATMVPYISGDSLRYEEEAINAAEWLCTGCRLVWDRRAHAEGCEARGHLARWEAGPYGRYWMENGVLKGNPTYYPRRAIRREGAPAARTAEPVGAR